MNALAKFFRDNYKFTLVLTLVVVVFGIQGLNKIKAESYPSVDFATATITTSLDGASAEEIETSITKPIEDEIRSVSGIKDVRSTSQPGLSKIVVRADMDNENTDEVMSDLQRAIDRVSNLPPEVKDKPKFVELNSQEFPVIEIAVIGSNNDRGRDLVADALKEEIEDNRSVLSVRLTGYLNRQFNIELNATKMDRHFVGINQVLNQIQMRNVSIPGGKLEQKGGQKLLRVEGEIGSKEDIENIVVRSNFNGQTVLLKDLASVTDGEEAPKILTKYEGREATLLIVTKKSGADTIAMVDDIEQKIQTFRAQHTDFEFVIYANESTKVKEKLGTLASNALTGFILVMFFLLLFLPFRIGLVASLSLPLGVLATMGFLPLLGMNLNTITILALVIALGMLVDNSVVIAENYARLRNDGMSKPDAAAESIRTLWLPISATVFTTIAAFLAMLVTTGVMGEFIKYIPIIVSLSLLISLGESFFLLPMRLTRFDAKSHGESKEGFFDRVAAKFEVLVRFLVKRRYFTLVLFTGSLVLSFVLMIVFNKMILFPSEQTEVYNARIELVKGSTLEETDDAIKYLNQEIMRIGKKYFKHVTSRSGSAQTSAMDPRSKDGSHVGLLFMYANDDTKNFVRAAEVLKDLRTIEAPKVIKEIVFEAIVNGPPVGEPVNVTFRSNNMASLNAVIDKITAKLGATDGIQDVNTDQIVSDDEVFIDVDYATADRLGINVNGIGNTIRPAIQGKNVSTVTLDSKDVELNVRMRKSDRLKISDLNKIKIADQKGNLIPLSSVAKFRKEAGGPQIKRFDFKRSTTISANIVEGKITALEANKVLSDEFATLQKQYPDVSTVVGGEQESTKESLNSLFEALSISLIVIFALLVLLFSSFVMPFIIMTTIPLGLVGFSIAFYLHGKPISFLALIGIIGLGGIIVNSGIILISFINELREDPNLPLHDALAKASRLRLRAVVVSSLTTISGLIPTAYGIGGMDAMLMPMTLAMAWGLTSGTILTLLWVPCAYAISDDFNKLFAKIVASFKRLLGRSTPSSEKGA